MTTNAVIATAGKKLVLLLFVTTRNILDIAIKVGNLPLHGTKLLVKIAIRRSLGDSIILQDIIPAALHQTPYTLLNTVCHEHKLS